MGWLDDFATGFAEGFIPTYTNRIAQQQRQDDALELKYYDKFATVKAKNDKAAKLRKAQLSKARSIVSSMPSISSYTSTDTAVKYVADLIINQDLKDEKKIKENVKDAMVSGQLTSDTTITTDFSYVSDAMPQRPTASGGTVDTTNMSKGMTFLSDALGVSKRTLGTEVSSPSQSSTSTSTNVEKVKVETSKEKEEEEEEKVSGVVTQSFKPLKRPFDSVEAVLDENSKLYPMVQGDLEATQAIMDEQTGGAFPGAVTSSAEPLTRPSVIEKMFRDNGQKVPEEVIKKKFHLKMSEKELADLTDWEKFQAWKFSKQQNYSFKNKNNGEFNYGEGFYSPSMVESLKTKEKELLVRYQKENPEWGQQVKDVVNLQLPGINTALQQYKEELITKGVVPKNKNWKEGLTPVELTKLNTLYKDDEVTRSIILNLDTMQKQRLNEKKNNEASDILKPSTWPSSPTQEDFARMIVNANVFGIDPNNKFYKLALSNMTNEKYPANAKELAKLEANNKDPYSAFRDVTELKGTSNDISHLKSLIASAQAVHVIKPDEELDSLIKDMQARLSILISPDVKIAEPVVDTLPSFSINSITSKKNVDDLPGLENMAIELKKLSDEGNPDAENRLKVVNRQIKLLSVNKQTGYSFLNKQNGDPLQTLGEIETKLIETTARKKELVSKIMSQDGQSSNEDLDSLTILNTGLDFLNVKKEQLQKSKESERKWKALDVATVNEQGKMVKVKGQQWYYSETGHWKVSGSNVRGEEVYDINNMPITVMAYNPQTYKEEKNTAAAALKNLNTDKINAAQLLRDLSFARELIVNNPDVVNIYSSAATTGIELLTNGIEIVTSIFGGGDDSPVYTYNEARTKLLQKLESAGDFTEGQRELAVVTLSIVYGLAGSRGSTGMALSDREMANISKTVIIPGNTERSLAVLNGHFQDTLSTYEDKRMGFLELQKTNEFDLFSPSAKWWNKNTDEIFKAHFSAKENTFATSNVTENFDSMMTGERFDSKDRDMDWSATSEVLQLEMNDAIVTWGGNLDNKSQLLEMYRDMKNDVESGNLNSKALFMNTVKRTTGFPVREGVDFEAPLFEFLESTLQRINKLRETN